VAAARVEVDVDGRRLELSNLDKVLYPEAGFTKAQVIDYYTRVAPVMLPHLADRPLTLHRFPNGTGAKGFYEKQCPDHRPDWVATTAIRARGVGRFGERRRDPRDIDFCLVQDRPTLVWLANLACLELHVLLAREADVARPTAVVFDLDPGAPAGVVECARVALLLRDALDALGLTALIKTSGSKGLQVYVPLNRPADYDGTKSFARSLARLLEKEHPELVVSRMKRELRGGKVYVDWQQNEDFKTTVCAYSLRARPQPTASTPLSWEEVDSAAADGNAGALAFEAGAVLERAERHGDLFAAALELEQDLPTGP
jgi:bifunctional non-homologous end joining protein LigD